MLDIKESLIAVWYLEMRLSMVECEAFLFSSRSSSNRQPEVWPMNDK